MEELPEILELCRNDFKSFVEIILGLKNEDFHNEVDDAISNDLFLQEVITIARGSGKSKHISIAYPLWLIAKNHNIRILLVSATASVTQSFLSEIVTNIERNKQYRAFAKYVDKKENGSETGVVPKMKNYSKAIQDWSGNSITIERKELNLKDPTIHAVGLFGSILSKRADVILIDDACTQENTTTEEQRKKIHEWIVTTVKPVLVPGGKFIYLGNTWHQDDTVARFLKDPLFDFKLKLKSIIHEPDNPALWEQWAKIRTDEANEPIARIQGAEKFYEDNKVEMEKGVKVLWPSRFPYKFLYLERMSNPYAFARMYQCDPTDRPDQKFKDAWLEEATRKGKAFKLQDERRDGFIMELTTVGVDLAVSEKDTSDDTVLFTIDIVKSAAVTDVVKVGDIIVRNIKRGKYTPNQTKEMIRTEYEKNQVDGIRLETVGYQEAMQRDLDDMGVPVHGYKTGAEKRDPFIGINSLAIYFEQGKVILPYDNTDPRTISLVSQLLNELRAWPDGHTGDSLMAFWFSFSEMRDLRGGRIYVPEIETVKDPILTAQQMRDPVLRKPEEKKADREEIGKQLERTEEQAFFREAMGGFWTPRG
jgi:hypothetical protein